MVSTEHAWAELQSRHHARAAVAQLVDAAADVVRLRDGAARAAARDVLAQALAALDKGHHAEIPTRPVGEP